MEVELLSEISKLLDLPGAILATSIFILWAQRQLRVHFSQKKQKHTETLSNLVEYINSNKSDPFVTEQLFLDHFRLIIPYRGIKLFIRTDFPSKHIFSYLSGMKYVEFDENYRGVRFYKSKNNLIKEQVLAWFTYVGVGGLGVSMLLSGHKFIEYEFLQYIVWYVISLYICAIGILGLDTISRVEAAKKLVNELGLDA